MPCSSCCKGQSGTVPSAPLLTLQSFVKNSWLLPSGGIGLHLPLPACLSSQCVSCHILFPNEYLHVNNAWHSTAKSLRGRSNCKYPSASQFTPCPHRGRGIGNGGENPSQEHKVFRTVCHILAGVALEQVKEMPNSSLFI